MTAEECYKKAAEALEERMGLDLQLRSVLRRMDAGKATDKDMALYTERMAQLIGSVMAETLSDAAQPLAKEYVCKQLLKAAHGDLNGIYARAQEMLDEKSGIHIKPQKADFPEERAYQVAHSLEDPKAEPHVIRRRANTATANVVQSFHDDYARENAKFRSNAGLKCYITRITDGKCCKWCSDAAGRYVYGNQPADIFKRHDNCGCSVVFESGRSRQDVWSKKTWSSSDASKDGYRASRMTSEQARALESQNLRYIGVDKSGESGIISYKISDRVADFYAESDNVFDFEKVEENLSTTAIGQGTTKYIEENGMYISVYYNYDSGNIAGQINGREIVVFADNHSDEAEIASTIIHEVSHERFNWKGTQETEINCYLMELIHQKGSITNEDINYVVSFVKSEYSHLPEGELYGL